MPSAACSKDTQHNILMPSLTAADIQQRNLTNLTANPIDTTFWRSQWQPQIANKSKQRDQPAPVPEFAWRHWRKQNNPNTITDRYIKLLCCSLLTKLSRQTVHLTCTWPTFLSCLFVFVFVCARARACVCVCVCGEGPRSRCNGRTSALRLIVPTCDKDD
jgi:hypothetical protein